MDWIKDHSVRQLLEESTAQLLVEKPDDPLLFCTCPQESSTPFSQLGPSTIARLLPPIFSPDKQKQISQRGGSSSSSFSSHRQTHKAHSDKAQSHSLPSVGCSVYDVPGACGCAGATIRHGRRHRVLALPQGGSEPTPPPRKPWPRRRGPNHLFLIT